MRDIIVIWYQLNGNIACPFIKTLYFTDYAPIGRCIRIETLSGI